MSLFSLILALVADVKNKAGIGQLLADFVALLSAIASQPKPMAASPADEAEFNAACSELHAACKANLAGHDAMMASGTVSAHDGHILKWIWNAIITLLPIIAPFLGPQPTPTPAA